MKIEFKTYDLVWVPAKARVGVENDPQAFEERNVKWHKGKIISTVLETKGRFIEKQIIHFVVMLPDGTFTNVKIKDCRKAKNIFQRLKEKL